MIGEAHDALNFVARIDAGVVGCLPVFAAALWTPEVKASSKFADTDEVGAVNEVGAQRRLVDKSGKSGYGAYVGIQPELFAHGEQSLFRTHFCGRVVVVFRRADGTEQHCVRLHAEAMGLLGIRRACGIDGAAPTRAV